MSRWKKLGVGVGVGSELLEQRNSRSNSNCDGGIGQCRHKDSLLVHNSHTEGSIGGNLSSIVVESNIDQNSPNTQPSVLWVVSDCKST